MATTSKHKANFTSKPTSQLRNRPTRQVEQRRNLNGVPEMSPEARRAILLSREDTKSSNDSSPKKGVGKENIKTPSRDSDQSSNVDPNNNTLTNKKFDNSKTNDNNIVKSSASSTATSIRNARISISSSKPPRAPKTARSRSTVSQNEPPFSMSDNNELSSYLGTNTNSNASVYTSNLSTNNNHNNNNGNNRIQPNYAETNVADDDDNDSALPNDESFDDDEDGEVNKDSFVLALDKALERSYVSRLKGDITDTSRDSKPGTVRALNGGRLTNAQEVVVNVCHNDDTELVFHDDDEESIDAAKAISDIRVNIWMEYNSRFPQDDIVCEPELDNNEAVKEINPKTQTSPSKPTQPSIQSQRRGSLPGVINRSREKTTLSVLGTTDRRVSNSKDRSGSKNSVPKNLRAERSVSNSRLRNIPPSPASSLHSSGGSNTNVTKSKPTATHKPRR